MLFTASRHLCWEREQEKRWAVQAKDAGLPQKWGKQGGCSEWVSRHPYLGSSTLTSFPTLQGTEGTGHPSA